MTNVPQIAADGPGLTPHEAQALAHPSRRGIAEALGSSPSGMTVTELAGRIGLHPNAIRQHLSVMQRAGILRVPVALGGTRSDP